MLGGDTGSGTCFPVLFTAPLIMSCTGGRGRDSDDGWSQNQWVRSQGWSAGEVFISWWPTVTRRRRGGSPWRPEFLRLLCGVRRSRWALWYGGVLCHRQCGLYCYNVLLPFSGGGGWQGCCGCCGGGWWWKDHSSRPGNKSYQKVTLHYLPGEGEGLQEPKPRPSCEGDGLVEPKPWPSGEGDGLQEPKPWPSGERYGLQDPKTRPPR